MPSRAPRIPGGPPVRKNLIYNDHTGNPAMMSWLAEVDQDGNVELLPTLESWVFYMTSRDIRCEDFEGASFKFDVRDRTRLDPVSRGSRYEFLFLPGATPEQCVEHYREEMLRRGTIWRQVNNMKDISKEEAAESDARIDPRHTQAYGDVLGEGQELPGFLWPNIDVDFDGDRGWYRGWLFIYPHGELPLGGANDTSRDVCLVRFHPEPIPHDDEPEDQRRALEHLQKVTHTTWMPLYDDGRNRCWPSCALDWMDIGEQAHWRIAANDVTRKAGNLGWLSW